MKKIIILLLVLILQSACSINRDNEKDIVKQGELEDSILEVSVEDKIIIERSEILSDYIVELFGVDDAGTIILNDTALVSLVMSRDSELTEDTKELIKNIIIKEDKEINNVVISEDEKVFNDIIDIMLDLIQGSSYDSQVKRISKLIEKTKANK